MLLIDLKFVSEVLSLMEGRCPLNNFDRSSGPCVQTVCAKCKISMYEFAVVTMQTLTHVLLRSTTTARIHVLS